MDLSIGDPDLPVNVEIEKELINSMKNKNYNQYPPYDGMNDLKMEIINYYEDTYNVHLNSDEVIILIGSKEGISNLIPAVCDVNDYVLVPEPGYPVYKTSAHLWGCKTYTVPLKKEFGFFPEIRNIPEEIGKISKLMFVNYPNNPTGASANEGIYKKLIDYCSNRNIVLANDGAYNEIIKSNSQPISLLQFDNNKSCIEFGSFSKTYNMTGYRIGFAVGNKAVINALLKVKSNVDSGQFKPIQYAAIKALKLDRSHIESINKIYDNRRRIVENILEKKNITFFEASGAFYIWCKVPKNYTVDEFCEELIEDYGIIVTPGYCFGTLGDGYFRIALTKEKNILEKYLNKLKVYK